MSAVALGAVAQPRERLISPVLVTMLAFCAIGLAHLVQANGGITLALGISGIAGWVVWAIYGSIAVLIVLFAQRFAHRPAAGVLLALAWGGLAATWAAELANGGLSDIFIRLTGSDPHAWLSTPVVEESVKALGVIGLAMIPILRRFRALDGLFYGVLIGAGFQVVEDGVFTLTALFNDPLNPMADILGNVVLRGFFF
jgi:RsiW-degrading membrane proteinase PrsW (M82 family)